MPVMMDSYFRLSVSQLYFNWSGVRCALKIKISTMVGVFILIIIYYIPILRVDIETGSKFEDMTNFRTCNIL